jgi:thiamine-monophosphate kinase
MEKLEDLGEFGLIDRIKSQQQSRTEKLILGIGDDAAVIDQGSYYELVSTESLLEGVHFDLTYTPLKHLGYKLVSVGVSDIAAMNGIPEFILVNLSVSNRFGLEDIDQIYEGIQIACEDYKVSLIGGDTSSSRSGLILSISSIGKVNKENLVRRAGAKPNDIICVSGDLGAAYMGLQVLERDKREFLENPHMKPNLEDKSYIVGKQLKPTARLDIIHELKEKNIVPSSMIDISDGLSSDLIHLSRASNLGYSIFFDNVPIDNQTLETCTEFNLNPVASIMHGGDDFELLFTVPQSDYDKIKKITDISMVGYVTENVDNWLVLNSGEKTKITAQGFPNG